MEDDVKDIIKDMLNGLRIMHSENFAHRDLKPAIYSSSKSHLPQIGGSR